MKDFIGGRHALVFGATGFLGRWLIVELAAQGVLVTAAVRSTSSAESLQTWLAGHGVAGHIETRHVDFDSDDLGIASDAVALRSVTEIYNLAGAFRFGMSEDEAIRGNVLSARRIVMLAARLPSRPRSIHVSGYRVGSHGGSPQFRAAEARAAAYTNLGAYEASKIEADAVVQETAANEGVPFTIINPSTVSGVSTTGESDQQVGLAASLKDLWSGRLAALPGNADTFVPVVTVDYLARFMALVPTVPETIDQSYWVLDENTPGLPALLTAIGRHYQVDVPRLRIPVGLVKRLPRRITKADPETLSFMSTDRYPTGQAKSLSSTHGLEQPETMPSILRWADHLAAHRFGQVAGGEPERSFSSYAGIHTFGIGNRNARTIVLPAIPVNADTWADTVARMVEPTRVFDLPGLGMSAGDEHHWGHWLAAIVDDRRGLHLVGHSIGAAAAVEFAATHPEQIERLTLVAPAFLQPAPGRLRRIAVSTTVFLRFLTPPRLSHTLLGSEVHAGELASSVTDLRRSGVARRVARLVARGARTSKRDHLRRRLLAYPGQVQIVVGEHDMLAPDAVARLAAMGDRLRITTIPGAGHYPQLSHPQQLVDALEAVGARSGATEA